MLTKAEIAVLDLLGEAFRAFENLDVMHPQDLPEFVAGIHKCQNIVLARSGLRAMANSEEETSVR
jgi:hypothetical protein